MHYIQRTIINSIFETNIVGNTAQSTLLDISIIFTDLSAPWTAKVQFRKILTILMTREPAQQLQRSS